MVMSSMRLSSNRSYQENIILIIRKNRSNASVVQLIIKRDVDQDGSIIKFNSDMSLYGISKDRDVQIMK